MADLVEGFVSLLKSDVGKLNLSSFAKKGDIKGARKVMQKNGVSPMDKDSRGHPALHVAMLHNQLKFAQWLLSECKVDIDCTENENLYTALHLMIKEEKWDNVLWLIQRGADWEAQASRAGETPMELVEATGNNRFLLKFKDACEAMEGKRERDKREAARPKAKPIVIEDKRPAPAPAATSASSSVSASSAAASSSAASGGNSQFTSATVALVKAVKIYKATCDRGDAAAADSQNEKIRGLFRDYKPLLQQNVSSVPREAHAKADESQQVLAKGLGALLTVGKAVSNDPSNAAAAQKLTQVSALLDKHFKRLIAIIVKKQYDVA